MIYIAVCDDEPVVSGQIKRMAVDFFRKKNLEPAVAEFFRGEDLLQYGGPMDILFLDIRMKGINGMKAAGRLRERGFQGALIFVTALKEPVFEAFPMQPFDYLVKPVGKEQLERTLERLLSTLQNAKGQNLLIRQGNDKNGACDGWIGRIFSVGILWAFSRFWREYIFLQNIFA